MARENRVRCCCAYPLEFRCTANLLAGFPFVGFRQSAACPTRVAASPLGVQAPRGDLRRVELNRMRMSAPNGAAYAARKSRRFVRALESSDLASRAYAMSSQARIALELGAWH